ncbi:hypothetical protein [Lactobacillus xylocopicola]|uniref:DUF350 domain-containing protein n=1 Tax=Lactobacillus xylocopicola TaxID=2976676 RepID=A0ABN6SIH8_9LACO|nr:hypothetical protein [Lactobacillus xylocopicola]BDR60130.1 hypothetical protein KIM322_03910 [Lactobacillus xylocopicola]
MFLSENLASLLKGSVIGRVSAVVLVVLGLVELLLSIKYSKQILQKGTQNGFAPISIASSLFFGLVLLVVGIMLLIATF